MPAGATGARRRASTADIVTSVDDIREMVAECARSKVSVVVFDMAPNNRLVAQGRFVDTTRNTVTIELLGPDSRFTKMDTMCLSFTARDRHWTCVGRLWSMKEDEALPQLVIAQPRDVVAVDIRMAYRVPVVGDACLTARMRLPSGTVEVHPLDLSLTGAQVESGAQDLGLKAGTQVDLLLRLPPIELDLPAVVARVEGSRLGFFFPSVLRNGELEPPAGLNRIVRRLEKAWLRALDPASP